MCSSDLVDVDEYYLLRARDFVTFDVDDSTLITVDGVKKVDLSEIEVGDYAEVRADEDNFAVEIKVNSCESKRTTEGRNIIFANGADQIPEG